MQDHLAQPRIVSAHGARIPAIGFGTSGLGASAASSIAAALQAGYRHLDCARKYGTEEGVGEGIRAAGIPRDEIFMPIPRSTNPQRMAENLDVFDFILDEHEMARIAALKRPNARIANPVGRAPQWD